MGTLFRSLVLASPLAALAGCVTPVSTSLFPLSALLINYRGVTSPVEFDDTIVGDIKTTAIAVVNVGHQDMFLLGADITGPDAQYFSANMGAGRPFPPGGIRVEPSGPLAFIHFTFQPDEPRRFDGFVMPRVRGGQIATFPVAITGRGVEQRELGNLLIRDVHTGLPLEFGQVPVNVIAQTTFTIENVGPDPQDILRIYTIRHRPLIFLPWSPRRGFTLAPGEKKVITVRFRPLDDIEYRNALFLQGTDGRIEIALTGEGVREE